MDLRIERQATQASVISEECAVVWGVRNHALIPLPLDGPERGRCVHWTIQSGKSKSMALLRKDSPQAHPFAARVAHLPVSYIT